jgi:HSP20 family protein
MTDLIRWRKGEDWDLTHMRREMDRLFDRFSEAWPFRGVSETGGWMPSVDVSETDKELVLILKGERKHEREEKKENFHLVERNSGSFSRSVQLPVDVKADKIKANYKDGVLSISMPKTEPEAVRKIEVKAN